MSISVGPEIRKAGTWLHGSGIVGSMVILLANILQGNTDELVVAR